MKSMGNFAGVEFFQATHADGCDFWEKMGPVFCDPDLRKEFDGPINSSAEHHWILGVVAGELVAFASRVRKGKYIWLDIAYVKPAYREKGVHSKMLQWRLDAARAEAPVTVRVCANESSRERLVNAGFGTYRLAGRWQYMEKQYE